MALGLGLVNLQPPSRPARSSPRMADLGLRPLSSMPYSSSSGARCLDADALDKQRHVKAVENQVNLTRAYASDQRYRADAAGIKWRQIRATAPE